MDLGTLLIVALLVGALIWLIFFVIPLPQWARLVFGIVLALVLFIYLLQILGVAHLGSLRVR